ncbi:hypothetical protein NIES208_10680 [[Limnothrix rosea] IAM M-220]|nr:hypothetical protein NIES208_10680 [[Limnothrix rosea] IAM M-220]
MLAIASLGRLNVKGSLLLLAILASPTLAITQSTPPPDPSSTSTIGQAVTNPTNGTTTTVTGLRRDPAGVPTAGDVAWVDTADGDSFLVKTAGDLVYAEDDASIFFRVVSVNLAGEEFVLDADADLSTTDDRIAFDNFATTTIFPDTTVEPTIQPPPINEAGADGITKIEQGNNGGNGRNGALFVPPRSGGDGSNGPTVNSTNNTDINATNRIGMEVASIGGDGGDGGDSFASAFSGRSGGDAGDGGAVNATSNAQVASTGDDQHGIFAYSRSGEAGDGGSGFLAPSGGSGGVAGSGGDVTVNNNDAVATSGDGAVGVYGLSASNTGGNGGSQFGIVGKSGDGGATGDGGDIEINNNAGSSIQTTGDDAHGILAQSIGGSGGNSGTSGNLIVSLQGSANNGGDGGDVEVTNNGLIVTEGRNAKGIFAQSLGGGGGSAGGNGALVAIGGDAAGGGDAGTVTVRNLNEGDIRTGDDGSGDYADGILAQSIGGSGGSTAGAGGLVALGGDGGVAGDGDVVTVENFGSISTDGFTARGIVAQSIGGGGGDSGSSGGLVSIGGSGDGGGDGDVAIARNFGNIDTAGDFSHGIVVQSIGGGGGNGASTSGLVSLGGSGSGGGTGDDVTVINSGTIETDGDDSRGILAQSIGGGGGNGGSSASTSLFAGVSIGGTAGNGNVAGDVNVTLQGQDADNASLIRTTGDRSTGLFAQSVGGGGGNGGGSIQATGGIGGAVSVSIGGSGGTGGNGGVVNLTKGTGLSIVETTGADSTGIMLQSVGGGGGNGGYAVSLAASGGPASASLGIAVGGDGAAGGDGGQVQAGTFNGSNMLTSTGFNGSILTTGDRSTGFLAQSTGGGGGNGGVAVAITGSASATFGSAISVGVGGAGGDGGDGGTVAVGIEGNITTEGASSTGFLAQSVGGGGGNGGGSVTVAGSGAGLASASINVGVGGAGGDGGDGGQVTAATRSGTISTGGSDATGILVQSVGGGGGNGGYSVGVGGSGAGVASGAINVAVGGSGGGGGIGNTVKADLESNVTTTGANSGGILAQSVGGGGGNGGFTFIASGSGAGVGSGAIAIGVGGSGGGGGEGGDVDASSTGVISTIGNSSIGFAAQSLGGGGGNGGFNITLSGSGAGVGSGTVNVGVGGSGGSGGDAGIVLASTSGNVTTAGDDSIGVLAQSIGGGGGNGGFVVSATGSGAGVGSGAVNIGVGGSGGAAGDGNTVDLTVTNDVTTSGDNSHGVVAQSIGGGGGNGGFSIAPTGSGAGVGSGSIGVSLGGDGSGGGDGEAATSNVTGTIQTSGNNSYGVLTQSLGGGGGNGGFNVTVTGSGAGVGSGSISVGLGGNGGSGGDGAEADATFDGFIATTGNDSSGFVAQSLGGGGGNGGFSITATGSGAGVGSGSVGVSVGGNGSAGGDGGEVEADFTGGVNTSGDQSMGIVAQSIGGSGGNGGFTISATGDGAGVGSGAVSVGVGGAGAGGGDASAVTLTVQEKNTLANTSITTSGDEAIAILAQSVGGGGGNGGFSVTASGSGAGVGSGGVSVGVGGGGGTAGTGGNVDLSFANDVFTDGENSHGVVAQSLGGGGGNGGFAVSVTGSGAGVGAGTVNVGVGGTGAGGGQAGTVDLEVTDDITILTQQKGSYGILAQSLGGGGGNGGFNVTASGSGAGVGSGSIGVGVGGSGGGGGNASAVTVTAANTVTGGSITTEGDESNGFTAQSIGGGGGNGGFNVTAVGSGAGVGSGAVSVAVGGSGGGAGNGGDVTAVLAQAIATKGNTSSGFLAQSVGGGGGNGGFTVNLAGSGAGTGSGTVSIGVGGGGGSAGNGSSVNGTARGTITTEGVDAIGFAAQSIGGGGGNGGFTVVVNGSGAGTGSGTLNVGVGGSGGGGGNASTVTALAEEDISTQGDGALGFIAQSLGGGGGNGGFNVSASGSGAGTGSGAIGISVGGSGGGAGNADDVTATAQGKITTLGDDATAFTAQSLGGGGGNGGFSVNITGSGAGTGSGAVAIGVGGSGGGGGTSGAVVAVANDDISTTGDRSRGFLAQSLGGGGGNGGFNFTVVGSGAGTGSGAINIGLGGSGGDGNDSGRVNATMVGDITTIGEDATGFMAQSIGGGGGNGAFNVSITGSAAGKGSGAFNLGLGGSGGSGGNAAAVTATTQSNISTTGDRSGGIFVQSLGGGGGNGGFNISLVGSGAKQGSGVVGIGIGGSGAGAGNAGDATLSSSTGNIQTQGDEAKGVVVQSIGGGGGNGGFNINGAGGGASSSGNGGVVGIGIGGSGGAGGNAGNVLVNQDGAIATAGELSGGLLAQSIGGGGGNGGFNVNGVIAINSSPIQVAVGGSGGGAGEAGSVTVNRGTLTNPAGNIFTNGTQSNGIEASSIGGGGGTAGINFNAGYVYTERPGFVGQFTIGGAGGNATQGSTVEVNNFSNITTQGQNSHGILAQSIGGGGGNANVNYNSTHANFSFLDSFFDSGDSSPADFNPAIGFSLGGQPADGGDSDTVDVVHVGDITTLGDRSFGVMAQSIGGGGGNADNGSDATFLNLQAPITEDDSDSVFEQDITTVILDVATGQDGTLESGGAIAIQVEVGRRGGDGGDAGDVTLDSTGVITTSGKGSHGLIAQSVGGGGGTSTTTSVSGSFTPDAGGASVEVSVGLEGGEGGSAGNVTVDAADSVTTFGEEAHAIFAQSVGGGGGLGGYDEDFGEVSTGDITDAIDNATSDGKDVNTNIRVGGTGGEGGIGGDVTVTSSATIATNADRSVGILAQSIGGGGGNGGTARTGYSSSGSNINVLVGGEGGEGMSGGTVKVDNSGSITTDGEVAHGIFAQSLGGGGGNGAMAVDANLISGKGFFNLSTVVGGSAGDAGAGGVVEVTNSDIIYTQQDKSVGIFAQSLGGGGGNGGTAIAGTLVSIEPAGTEKTNFGVTVGGNGGTGGVGNNVTVTNSGTIMTEGEESHGILAQSVGGGGGTGGLSLNLDIALSKNNSSMQGLSGTFAIGGQGGDGNTAGDVTVSNTGSIVVNGDNAHGIYAQSVGGGGGDGGFAVALSSTQLKNFTNPLSSASLLTFGMGGFNGTGADGGDVTINHTGSIISNGDNSYGVFAQSVGGGGGNSAYSVSSPLWTALDAVIKTISGSGFEITSEEVIPTESSSGMSGEVTINRTGDIMMLGANSQATNNQGINGGGGNTNLFLDFSDFGDEPISPTDDDALNAEIQVGSNDAENATANLMTVVQKGNMVTMAENSAGSRTQSIGGGGGNVNQDIVVDQSTDLNLTAVLGAINTNNSGGGSVEETREGDIFTQGDYSAGSSTQSIGGGGGYLRLGILQNDGGSGIADGDQLAKITLGSDPSFNNDGNTVLQTLAGSIRTGGDMSPGLEVQSIGAGGGIAKVSGADSVEAVMGAQDDSTGDGKDVTVVNTGNLETDGLLSHAAVVQSIGGGGGFVLTGLDKSLVTVTPSAANGGDGGNIDFEQIGNISVGGDRSFGLFVQSLGGGGGLVDDFYADSAGGLGASGKVDVVLDGDLTATGEENVGLYAQSRSAQSTQGDIDITLTDDKTIWVNDSGIGVKISGGAENSFTNEGGYVIAASEGDPSMSELGMITMSTPDGYTVVGEEGNEVVTNQATGVFYGNMNLGGGNNTLLNELGGTIFAGTEMFIGEDGNSVFSNAGTISPGNQSVYVTEISGNYIQTKTADFDLTLDFTDDSLDRLNITEDASLEGDLNVLNTGIGRIKPGQRTLIFAATEGSITKETLNLVVPDSAIATFAIDSTDKIAFLDIDVDFQGFGALNRNQTAFGDYLNRVQLAGSDPSLAPLIEGIFALAEPLDLRTPYDSLSPEIYGSIHTNFQLTSQQLRDDLFTCKASGDQRILKEGECLWLDIAALGNNGDRTSEYFDFETSVSAISGGAQLDLGEQWYLALAAGASVYETSSAVQPAMMNGSSNQAGLAVKKSFGNTDIGLGVVGGSGEFDAERFNLFPTGDRVTSEQDASFFGSWLRISHDIDAGGGWYVRPMLDFGSTRVKYNGFEETGAGALNLIVDDSSQAYVTLNPAIEFGGEFKDENLTIRPTIYLGYTHYLTDPNPSTSARLAGAPQGVDSFEVTSLGDRSKFDAAANVELLFLNGLSMKLGYWGQFSRNTTVHGADFKMKFSF